MDWNEIVTLAAVFVGTGFAAYLGYTRKFTIPKQPDPVLTGVGLAFGGHEQMERLIKEVKRIADILSDKNTEGVYDRLEDLASKFDELAAKQNISTRNRRKRISKAKP